MLSAGSWEVVVVGGGHAGCEAALASARLGRETLLVTSGRGAIARMSCNPAIGGLAKGQVVREVDALGGAMGLVADRTGIQFKVLNRSRGAAVRGLRCQSDKAAYAAEMLRIVESTARLSVVEGCVKGFRVEGGRVGAVVLEDGSEIRCRSAVVTSGTFLRGLLHVGPRRERAGRWGEPPAEGLSAWLAAAGLRLGRMKTGTPPRVRLASLDLERMAPSLGDTVPVPFSFRSRWEGFPAKPQVACWVTYTSSEGHDVIRRNLGRSPLYSGQIVGRGPRYCPSIEDKVVRFPDRDRHQIFVEMEGLQTDWVYLNGLSMSLPEDVQLELVRSIRGLERAEVVRPAYAIEYDMVFPEQLDDTLQVRGVEGLFLAGQINGTSGYEEAAGQGVVSGSNAALSARGWGKGPLVLGRHEAYIGVMIDDLVTLGLEEPYRLLTSRAEHRLLLGPDTAYARLTPLAFKLGLVDEDLAVSILGREERLRAVRRDLDSTRVPSGASMASVERTAWSGASPGTPVGQLLRRPDQGIGVLVPFLLEWMKEGEGRQRARALDREEWERLASEYRYEGFVRHAAESLARVVRAEGRRIPPDFSYRGLPGLSGEAAEKLERHRPRTLGQAGRIPGVTPAAVTLLLSWLVSAPARETSL